MDVNKKLEALIAYNSNSTDISFDKDYQTIFEGEGVRKSKYIIDTLSTNSEVSKEDMSNYVFVSIGGADGSEAEEILRNTRIEKAILLEISEAASKSARKKAENIQKELGKELVVLQGDATQKLDDVINCMENFKKNSGCNGTVLSMQAILHELPKRSLGFRQTVFFGQLFGVFSKNIFFGREPIKVERWPDIIELKAGNGSSANLAKLADIINEKLSIAELETKAIANNYINIDSTLALELLHKLIRSESVSKFKYELGEQLTSVDIDLVQKIIENHLGIATVIVEPMITEGFKEAWKLHDVQVKDEQGKALSFPNTHARIVAISIHQDSPSNLKIGKNVSSRQLKKNTEKGKIKTVSKRTEIRASYRETIEGVASRFCVYGVGLGGFADEYRELIQQKIRDGIEVKILALSPREEIFRIYFDDENYSLLGWKDFESGNGGKAQNDSKYLQDWVFEENLKILKEGGTQLIELRFYSSLPVGAIMIADDTIFYSPSLINNSDDNTTMVFEKRDKLYDKFNRYFEDLWESLSFSQSAISSHVLYNTNDNGCLIDAIRQRRKYKINPNKVIEEYSSFVDHAKNKLLYNELAPLFLQAASRNTQKEVDFIRSMENLKGETIEYIVDLGCGVGRHASTLSAFYKVTAFDLSEKEIDLASKSSGADFFVGDIREWSVDQKSDLIICMWSTLNYLSTQNDLDRFIECCNKNIEDSGILLLDLKNPNKVIGENYDRKSYSYSYSYPYEMKVKIKKELINKNILNAIYTYEIKNVKTGQSVVATDQEINKKYELDDIKKSFSRDFDVKHVYGDYSINSEFTESSDRMIVVLQKK